MNKFEVTITVKGTTKEIEEALSRIAEGVGGTEDDGHQVAILDGVDQDVWEIENVEFIINQI